MLKRFKKKAKIEFYNSIEEIPHRNYMKFNKELMRGNEVGNSAGDVSKRIDKAIAFLKAKDTDKAVKELVNAKLAFNYAEAEIAPKGFALAAVVKSIDGKECNDLSSAGLQETLSVLQDLGITKKEVDETTKDIKKKLNVNWVCSFLRFLKGKILLIIRR